MNSFFSHDEVKEFVRYRDTPSGKLIHLYEFYIGIGYSRGNYNQFIETTFHPRGSLNVDYFWDQETHMPFPMPYKRIRYLITTEFAKAIALMPGTPRGRAIWQYIKATESKTIRLVLNYE